MQHALRKARRWESKERETREPIGECFRVEEAADEERDGALDGGAGRFSRLTHGVEVPEWVSLGTVANPGTRMA